MAKVSLRIYNREIENLVENSQLDEAIAHCRHILNAFPKYLETYRLLGKAYLEAKRYREATDIFERLLMAVPDDFVAHVGMSIIHDEQNNLDSAIWHMERAFEVQPSNAAIQAELQRLFGRRDGVEPPKIRLTRGALAHMYVQGELYPQAIAEINSVLEEDPERQDMQVLLARAYFHAGQKSEAAEICSQLLRRYPYCFDANRVLVELIPQTERGESTQVYRHRVSELDPYSTFATGSVFHTEEVADAALNLERLEWDGQPVDMQPEWGDSLGINRGDKPAERDEQPEWLKAAMTNESAPASTPDKKSASVSGVGIAAGDDQIPDFLREAGWGEDTGTFQEGAGIFEQSDDDAAKADIAEGELPDWVKAMAPQGADEISTIPPGNSTEQEEDLTQDDVPDWLQGLGDVQSTPSTEEEQIAPAEDIPEWLQSMKPEETSQPESQETPDEEPAGDGALPDWLQSMEADVQPEEGGASQETVDVSPESLSDWQIGDETLEPGATYINSLGASAEEQDDAMAWLESLASKHGAKPEELVTDPNARKETAPDWVQKASQAGAEQPPVVESPAPQQEEPVQPVQEPEPEIPQPSAGVEDLGVTAEEQDDAVAWLESLASKHGAKPEELVTDPNARKETAPDWVQKASQAGAEQPPMEESPTPQQEEPTEEEPEWMKHAKEVGESLFSELEEAQTMEPLPAADTDETGMWLRDLENEDNLIEEQKAEPAADADLPDWLGNLDEEQPEQAPLVAEPVAQPAEEEMLASDADLPNWLDGLDEEQLDQKEEPTTESTTAMPEGEALPEPPEWLSSMETGTSDAGSGEEVSLEEEKGPMGVVDLNTASREELADLPGIGDLLAQNIIAQREAFGDFSSLEDLNDIAGIGPATLDELRGLVVIEAGESAPQEAESPEWLRSMEARVPESDDDIDSIQKTKPEDLPSWLEGLDQQDEQEPATASQDMPGWLKDEAEQEVTELEPTTPDDWKPADEAEPAQAIPPSISMEDPHPEPEPKQKQPPPPKPVEPAPKPEPAAPPEREPYREPVTRSRTGMTGMLSSTQDPILIAAQNELTRSNIPAALEYYGKLIKKGKMLDEIIFDLREALYRYPVEVSIHQTLGDAYMRANRLQEALDSYTKAEELLR